MLDLRLVTVSDDGTALVLADPDGGSYRLPVDEALAAAVRGDRSRLGQLQIDTGDLRPRDIQTRVRAGASPEALSTASGMPLERVRRYAGPVLAEREHVAQQAQRATARTSSRGEGPAPVLYDAVETRLAAAGADVAVVGWDAWRRDDGTWTVEVTHPVTHAAAKAAGAGPARAHFAFDPATRTAVADDDAARWLLGEEPAPRAPFVPRLAPVSQVEDLDGPDELDAPGVVDLRAEPLQPAPDDDDADGAVPAQAGEEPRRDRRAERRARRAQPRTELQNAPTDRQAIADGVKPGRRAAVPSWDEILFGSSRPPQ
ncbi:Protein of unknown function (DUF3071) [Motilibacter peucedani]|uniref:DUF3071 domain-containing protein n=1 Tax=Motilibacter peucedani TaxID=598650 RepID=A0A420XS43_9ACTN|nr:septation protein SepH [Motilibacter peucedani]RKS77621.1 Protein of unknown function (DUF3071) [Motilibacter peucedani]